MWHYVPHFVLWRVVAYTHGQRRRHYDTIFNGLYGNVPHSATCPIPRVPAHIPTGNEGLTRMLDTDAEPCQTHPITAPVPEVGTDAPCSGYGETGAKTSSWGGPRPGFGGPQPGSGRPRKALDAPPNAEPEPLRWFCIRTDYGAELIADVAIRTAGFETFFPLLWVPPVAARLTDGGRAIPARSERLEPLLRRYLMVRFVRTDPSWRAICTMRGVDRIFSTHPERPTPIPDKDIEALREGLSITGVLYPPKKPERGKSAKKRWVDMATALLTMVGADV